MKKVISVMMVSLFVAGSSAFACGEACEGKKEVKKESCAVADASEKCEKGEKKACCPKKKAAAKKECARS